MPSPTLERRTQLFLVIGAYCVAFFIADVVTPICFSHAFPAMMAIGVVTAQLTVICVWGTLVRGTFWIRLPWTLLLLVASWCGFACGISIENGARNTTSMLEAAVFWTFGFVTSFVPLKIAALCFRWQIIQVSDTDSKTNEGSNYAIRDIMTGTLLLALSMGIARIMLHGEEIDLTRLLQSYALNDSTLLFAMTIFGIISLLVKLPCIWISLGEEPEQIKPRIVVWVVYCFLLGLLEIAILAVSLGNPGRKAPELFGGIILSHQVMGAIMLVVGLSLRGLGYRLERSQKGTQARVEQDDVRQPEGDEQE